jgi:hypothetical protein
VPLRRGAAREGAAGEEYNEDRLTHAREPWSILKSVYAPRRKRESDAKAGRATPAPALQSGAPGCLQPLIRLKNVMLSFWLSQKH